MRARLLSLLRAAAERRAGLAREAREARPTTAYRLFHRAADGEPSLSVDVYGEHLVAHLYAVLSGADEDAWLDDLAALGYRGVYLKRHPRQKNELVDPKREALAPAAPLRGVAAAEELVVFEQGLPFGVRLGDGLRTGLFLDQRDNRRRVATRAAGKRVLNLFAYTGGFSVAALAGGAAEAICVDSSAAALSRAQDNVARIEATARHRTIHDDAFDVLRRLARRGERFDLVIVDPPSYATTRARRFVLRRDYTTLCEAVVRLLSPRGELLACANHHGTSDDELRRFVEQAARAAGRVIARCRRLPPGLDFPVRDGQRPEMKSLLVCFS